MKQKYMKPAMVMERFELSQSIATGCGAVSSGHPLGNPNQWTKQTCGWFIDAETILWFVKPTCTEELLEGESVEGLCYNNPNGGQSIFNS